MYIHIHTPHLHYQFLCLLYGISGASGTNYCGRVWRTCTRDVCPTFVCACVYIRRGDSWSCIKTPNSQARKSRTQLERETPASKMFALRSKAFARSFPGFRTLQPLITPPTSEPDILLQLEDLPREDVRYLKPVTKEKYAIGFEVTDVRTTDVPVRHRWASSGHQGQSGRPHTVHRRYWGPQLHVPGVGLPACAR